MKTLNCKINDSAYKKFRNLQVRKGYKNPGDLIAYLVKQENKLRARNSSGEKDDNDLSRKSSLSGHKTTNPKRAGMGTGHGHKSS